MAGVDDFNLDLEDLAADVIPVVKEGYLKKKKTKGVRFGRTIWNSRYFQVNNVERALLYSKTEDSPVLKKIPFDSIVSCKFDNSDNKKKNKIRFRLVTKADNGDEYDENPYRKYFFEAESPSKAKEWVKCLHELSSEYIEKKKKRERIVMNARMSTIPYNPNGNTKNKLIPLNLRKSDQEDGKQSSTRRTMNRTASAIAVETEFDDDAKSSLKAEANKCLCCIVQ